ncbi:MAG: DUF5666 domain-containing protein [bacterium]
MNKNIVAAIVGIIIVGGGAFYMGDVYGAGQAAASQAATGTNARQFAGGGMMGNMRTGRTGGGFTSGQIVSVDNGSVTVKMASGSTQIILTSGTTQIFKSAAGTASDLSVGTTVTATGSANSDGSLTAQTIQIRPAGMPTRQTSVTPSQQ